MSRRGLTDATELEPGDRIAVGRYLGDRDIRTVTAPTSRDRWGGCDIHTDRGTITTGLPCPVKVVG